MNPETCRLMMVRDLECMRAQIAAYPDESMIWSRTEGIANPPGNLALHVAGNVQHFIGHVLGGTDYQRQRDLEFSTSSRPRSEVDAELSRAAEVVDRTLGRLDDATFSQPFPIRPGDLELVTGVFVTHLCGHLAYHLGQVDAHRRMTTGQGALPGMQSFASLAT